MGVLDLIKKLLGYKQKTLETRNFKNWARERTEEFLHFSDDSTVAENSKSATNNP